MTRRRRLRRRLVWAGVLFGLVLLLVAVSTLRVCAWGRGLLTDNASRLGRRALERKEEAMTRTLTLVVGIAIAALTIAPMALGEGRLAPLYPPSQVTTYQEPRGHPPARTSMLELANAAGKLDVATISKALATYRDGPERTIPVSTTVQATSASSGSDIEWSQVGVAFGLGILLAVGLGLGVRAVRARPIAH